MVSHFLIQILTVTVLFLGGALGGSLLAASLTGGSPFAQFVGFLVFPVSFALALICWRGFAIVMMLGRWVFDSAFRRRALDRIKGVKQEHMQKTGGTLDDEDRIEDHFVGRAWIMVPVPWIICTVVGPVIGLLSSNVSFVSICVLYSGLGLVYGLAMYAAARRAWLPIPLDD